MGHTGGISTMLVPGAGEPNFDSYVADPFQGKRARQEQEVHQLLDKLKPEMIVLDPTTIGRVSCPAVPQHCTVATTLGHRRRLGLGTLQDTRAGTGFQALQNAVTSISWTGHDLSGPDQCQSFR